MIQEVQVCPAGCRGDVFSFRSSDKDDLGEPPGSLLHCLCILVFLMEPPGGR